MAPRTLDNQVVVVTGGGRGIGRAICQAVAAEGAVAVPTARTLTEISETARLIEEAGGRALPIRADITDEASVKAMAERIVTELGRVDVLFNNAGSFYALGSVAEVPPAKWWDDVTINLLGTYLPCHYLLPTMIAAGRGTVVTMLGGGTGNPLPMGSGYASSKAGVLRFTECLAGEVAEHGIAVVCMSPGFVRTRITEHHVFSAEGNTALPSMQGLFDEGQPEYPPDAAAAFALELCKHDLMPLTGRYMGVGDDVDALLVQAEEIVASDKRQLRLT
jgi:NAD(P)-dependent dehydrogenase (short-subunit alcohol dehydrogenase family)